MPSSQMINELYILEENNIIVKTAIKFVKPLSQNTKRWKLNNNNNNDNDNDNDNNGKTTNQEEL